MKAKKKILLISIIGLLFIYGTIYTFIALRGVSFVSSRLEKLTHKNVTVGSVRFTPFFNLEVRDLNIQGVLKVKYISLRPSLFSLLTGRIGFNEIRIVKPELVYARYPAVDTVAAAQSSSANSLDTIVVKKEEKTHFSPIFKHINITQGQIDILDYSVGVDNAIKLTIKDILFDLENLAASHSAVTNFELKGSIPWQAENEEGKISLEGWIDLIKQDMHASLEIKDIDGIYLYPYYRQWVDLKNSIIEKAKLNFTSNIQGVNNNITAQCRLELNDLVFKHDDSNEQSFQRKEKMTNTVLGLFKSPQNTIVLDFTHKTKMDNPQFGFINIKGAVENKLASLRSPARPLVGDIFTLPVKVLQGIVVSTTDLSKAAIDGTFAVGNELKKSLAASFTREKKE